MVPVCEVNLNQSVEEIPGGLKGEVGCCDSWMAERIHSLTEKWLERRAIYLSIYLSSSLAIYLSSYLSISLSIGLSVDLSI